MGSQLVIEGRWREGAVTAVRVDRHLTEVDLVPARLEVHSGQIRGPAECLGNRDEFTTRINRTVPCTTESRMSSGGPPRSERRDSSTRMPGRIPSTPTPASDDCAGTRSSRRSASSGTTRPRSVGPHAPAGSGILPSLLCLLGRAAARRPVVHRSGGHWPPSRVTPCTRSPAAAQPWG